MTKPKTKPKLKPFKSIVWASFTADGIVSTFGDAGAIPILWPHEGLGVSLAVNGDTIHPVEITIRPVAGRGKK